MTLVYLNETTQIELLIMDVAEIKAEGHRAYLGEVFWQFSSGELTTDEMIEQITHVHEIVSEDFHQTIRLG